MGTKRIVYYDLLNIAACFCVICLHCNVMVHTYVPGENWMAALFVEVVCYWAVPIFFMLSGANLMRFRDRYDVPTFFKKRFVKILIPFLAWSTIIYVVRHGIEANSPTFGIGEFLLLIPTNGIEAVYWFFFPLFAVYLAMPVLSLLADHKRTLTYAVAVAFILQSLCPLIAGLFDLPWNTDLSLPVAGGYVIYALTGYLLATTNISRKLRFALYGLGIASFALRYFYTLFGSVETGVLDASLFNYMLPTALFPAVAVFLWFKHHDWKRMPNLERKASVIARISSCSFGIYLIHKLILDDIIFRMLGVPINSILLRIIGPFILYGICLAIVLLIKKIPVLKNLVP